MEVPEGVEVFKSLLRDEKLPFPARCFLRLAEAVYGCVSKPGMEAESFLDTFLILGVVVGFVAGVVVAAATVLVFWVAFSAGC